MRLHEHRKRQKNAPERSPSTTRAGLDIGETARAYYPIKAERQEIQKLQIKVSESLQSFLPG
jgi:hypothetical protein